MSNKEQEMKILIIDLGQVTKLTLGRGGNKIERFLPNPLPR